MLVCESSQASLSVNAKSWGGGRILCSQKYSWKLQDHIPCGPVFSRQQTCISPNTERDKDWETEAEREREIARLLL